MVFLNCFADHHAAVPNFSLVNKQSLDKILQAKVFVHKDSQLQAAHLILGYTPISSSFQAPKCVIRAKDPRLHLINVVVLSFLNPGSRPQGVLKVEPILQYKAEDEATPSQPTVKGEEEEKVVEVLDSEDDFEVFNQPESPEASTNDFSHLPSAQVSQIQEDFSVPKAMGIQRKPRAGLLGIMESQSENKVPERRMEGSKVKLIKNRLILG